MYKRYLEPASSSLSGNPTKYILKKLKMSEFDSTPSQIGNDCLEDKNKGDNKELEITRVEDYEVGQDEEGDENVEMENGLEEDEYYDAEEDVDSQVSGNVNCEIEIDDSSDEDDNNIDGDDFFNIGTDEFIHPNLQCKIADAILMILSFFLRHRLTWVALEDLLTLFDSIIGDQSRLPKTKYFFKKAFGVNQHSEAIFHFYCKNCNLYLDTYNNLKACDVKKEVTSCSNCSTVFSLHRMNDGHFFIQLPIRNQLQNKINNNHDILNYNTQSDLHCINDIYDGKLYKELREKVGNGKLVTLTINTDGVRMFKSKRKSSLWPIQLFVNEMSPVERFKVRHIILSGIWYGKDPDFHVYMKPFTDELDELNKNKIKVRFDNRSHDVTVKGFLFSTDTPAKCKVEKFKQFNGSYGCPYCLHPGDKSYSVNNNSKYPITPEFEYPLRTHKGTLTLIKEFLKTGISIFGIVGVSPLLAIKDFDLIRGCVIDYMHCVLLGVVIQMNELWFDSKNHFNEYYITPRGVEIINKNIECIQGLKNFIKKPRLMEERAFWKANELRNWLLYYAVPCLKGVQKDKYLQHFALLSESIFILLKTSISPDELKKADRNLKQFVIIFESFYGKDNMVFNVHLLTHLIKCVLDCGPLWAYSNFNFESNNGVLVRNVSGTTDVEHQILSKYIYNDVLNNLKTGSDKASEYINKTENTRVKNSKKIGEITLLGKSNKQHLNAAEEIILKQKSILAYNKFCYSNDIFYSTSYKLAKTTNDTVVRMKDGSFGQISAVYENEETVFLLLKCFGNEPNQYPQHLKKVSTQNEIYVTVRADEILEKCALISTSKETYVSPLPNRFESD